MGLFSSANLAYMACARCNTEGSVRDQAAAAKQAQLHNNLKHGGRDVARIWSTKIGGRK